MILLIDNYDSFSYNLVQLIGSICMERKETDFETQIRVVRNDELTLSELAALSPSHIILSPGPGRPADAGICEAAIKEFAGKIPILGVCLGHQAICECFGAEIMYADTLMHGKQSIVSLQERSCLFKGIPNSIPVARYHSLAARRSSFPEQLEITAETFDGEIMAVEHKKMPVFGLQFHPESILTPDGKKILENFLMVTV